MNYEELSKKLDKLIELQEAKLEDKVFYTQKELADRWQISHRTIENWRGHHAYKDKDPKRFTLKYYKFGGQVRYKIDDILKYEELNMESK